MAHPSETDPYAAPAEPFQPLDYTDWLQGFLRDQPVVWLMRSTRMRPKIGHVDGDQYPTGHNPEERYGLWVPAIREPRSAERNADDPYGYGTQSAALLAYLHDLHGGSSSSVVDLMRDPKIAAGVEAARALERPERVLMRGRATLHDLGAWPWAVVQDGVLPSRAPWWTDPAFTTALRDWDEELTEDLVSIDPWHSAS